MSAATRKRSGPVIEKYGRATEIAASELATKRNSTAHDRAAFAKVVASSASSTADYLIARTAPKKKK